jgi:hypothetical protein
MATAVFPGAQGPFLVPARERKPKGLPSLSAGRSVSNVGDLTIHRITNTHHGRTLLTLGHASEYLADLQRYSGREVDRKANVEAVHILMWASRMVFEEYAEQGKVRRRVEDWVVERVVQALEQGVAVGRGTGLGMSDNAGNSGIDGGFEWAD